MNDIHNQFVVTLRDKANGNIASVCQRFYEIVLIYELWLDHNDTGKNQTYILVYKTNNQVMSACITFLRNKFNLAVDKEKEKLFNINWITQLCKHPSKATFLKAAPEYSVKLLFKAVTSVLKLMLTD